MTPRSDTPITTPKPLRTPMSIRSRYLAAPTFPEYLETVEKNRDLWHSLYDRARVPDELVRAAERHEGRWHLLALSEDWCGDAVNTLPAVARWVEKLDHVDFRVLGRDDNPDIMDAHLTDGRSRSIPVVIVYDENFEEIGWWGPRPAELQEFVLGEGGELAADERYLRVRRWYARDRGRSVLEEILEVFEQVAA